MSYNAPALGASFIDANRGQRAPNAVDLIKELVGTAYACADLNASAVASATFRLLLKTGKGQPKTRLWKTAPLSTKMRRHLKTTGQDVADGEVEQITDIAHPLLALLARPTEDPCGLGSYDLRYCTQLYLESLGRAYWWIGNRNGLGVPAEIWLLRSHMVTEIPNRSGDGNLIEAYQYGKDRLDADDVIRFHLPDPSSLYYGGYGPMQAAIEKIRIGRKEDANIAALLDNMGRPDAIWSPKGDSEGGGIGKDEAWRMTTTFRQGFRGAGRGGIMVAESPGTMEVLGWKPQDIVEIERADKIKIDVLNVFGVPDAKLNRNAANLASAKTADYAHAKDAISPRLCRLSEVINARFVSLFDPTGRTFIAYDNPVPNDEVFELESTKTGAMQGAITINEIRACVGEEPIEGPAGEMRYINGTPIGPDGLPIVPKPETPPPKAAKRKNPTARKLADAAQSLSVAATRIAEANNASGATLIEVIKQFLTTEKNASTNSVAKAGQARADDGQRGADDEQHRDVLLNERGDLPGSAELAGGRRRCVDGAARVGDAAPRQAVVSDSGATVLLQCDESTKGEVLPTLRDGVQSGHGDIRPGAAIDPNAETVAGEVVQTEKNEEKIAGEAVEVQPGCVVLDDDKGESAPEGDEVAAEVSKDAAKAVEHSVASKLVPYDGDKLGNRNPHTGLAGPLPQGEAIAHIMRQIFNRQRAETLEALDRWEAEHAGKSIDGDTSGGADSLGEVVTKGEDAQSQADTETKTAGGELGRQLGGGNADDESVRRASNTDAGILGTTAGDDTGRHDAVLPAGVRHKIAPRISFTGYNAGLPSQFINATEWNAMIADQVQPVIEILANEGAKDLLTRVGASPDTFRVVNEEIPKAMREAVLKFSDATNATTSKQIDDAMNELREELAQGLEQGDARTAMRDRVQKVFDKAENERADTIAKTEASRATHKGEKVAAEKSGVVKKKTWLASADACPICDEYAAKGEVDLNEVYGGDEDWPVSEAPAHPNCFVGETPVLATGIFKGFAARYSGPLLRIVFASGGHLAVTPNHLLLTTKGFARAASLRQGDQLLYYSGFDLATTDPLVNPNNDGQPAPIQKVVASLAESVGVTRSAVPAAPEYLHGDAAFVDGNINIVSTDGLLPGDDKAATAQGGGNPELNVAGPELLDLSRSGDLASVLFALRSATDGGVGERREVATFGGRHAVHAKLLRCTVAPRGNASIEKTAANNGTGDTESNGNRLLAFPGVIPADGGGNVEDFTSLKIWKPLPSPEFQSELSSAAIEAGESDANGIRDVLQRFPGVVATRDVGHVDVEWFCGHVYDLETESSLYIANGIISTNCQCSMAYSLKSGAEIEAFAAGEE